MSTENFYGLKGIDFYLFSATFLVVAVRVPFGMILNNNKFWSICQNAMINNPLGMLLGMVKYFVTHSLLTDHFPCSFLKNSAKLGVNECLKSKKRKTEFSGKFFYHFNKSINKLYPTKNYEKVIQFFKSFIYHCF